MKRNANPLGEDQVKTFVRKFLEAQGWDVTVKMGSERGTDIETIKGKERWIVEAKGWGDGHEQKQATISWPHSVSFFSGCRTRTQSTASRSLTFPATETCGTSALAKRRTGITCIFVQKGGYIAETP